MSHVATVADHSDVDVTVAGTLAHKCPHVNEDDRGSVTITWRVNGKTFELHSLRKYLDGFEDAEMSHEQITDRIRHDLSVVDGINLISVDTTWTTAGMEVRCSSTAPTPADQP